MESVKALKEYNVLFQAISKHKDNGTLRDGINLNFQWICSQETQI
jgi:hypothetical protein